MGSSWPASDHVANLLRISTLRSVQQFPTRHLPRFRDTWRCFPSYCQLAI